MTVNPVLGRLDSHTQYVSHYLCFMEAFKLSTFSFFISCAWEQIIKWDIFIIFQLGKTKKYAFLYTKNGPWPILLSVHLVLIIYDGFCLKRTICLQLKS